MIDILLNEQKKMKFFFVLRKLDIMAAKVVQTENENNFYSLMFILINLCLNAPYITKGLHLHSSYAKSSQLF